MVLGRTNSEGENINAFHYLWDLYLQIKLLETIYTFPSTVQLCKNYVGLSQKSQENTLECFRSRKCKELQIILPNALYWDTEQVIKKKNKYFLSEIFVTVVWKEFSETNVDFTSHKVTGRDAVCAIRVWQEAAASGCRGDAVFEGGQSLLQSKLGRVKLTLQARQGCLK